MKLLISNDDGIHSPGIAALTSELQKEHEVVVCAPNAERSGASQSITFITPLVTEPACIAGAESVLGYAVSGTPADCVKLGCCNLATDVEMVVSGINHGANVGHYVLYSGTVSAAMEAASMGFMALAVSIDARFPKHLKTAAAAAGNVVRMMQENPLPKGQLLNLNVPDLPMSKIKGVKTAPLAYAMDTRPYVKRRDPYGRDYYWVPNAFAFERDLMADTDYNLLHEGFIVLTPLLTDRAAHTSFQFVEDHYGKGIADGEF